MTVAMFIDFDADQSGPPMQPVDSPHPFVPPTAHARAPLLISLGHFPLRSRPMTKGLPLLRGHAREERSVHGVEQIKIRDRCTTALF